MAVELLRNKSKFPHLSFYLVLHHLLNHLETVYTSTLVKKRFVLPRGELGKENLVHQNQNILLTDTPLICNALQMLKTALTLIETAATS